MLPVEHLVLPVLKKSTNEKEKKPNPTTDLKQNQLVQMPLNSLQNKKCNKKNSKIGKIEVYFKYTDQRKFHFSRQLSLSVRQARCFSSLRLNICLKRSKNTLRLVTCWSSGDIAHSVLSFHLSTVCYLHL